MWGEASGGGAGIEGGPGWEVGIKGLGFPAPSRSLKEKELKASRSRTIVGGQQGEAPLPGVVGIRGTSCQDRFPLAVSSPQSLAPPSPAGHGLGPSLPGPQPGPAVYCQPCFYRVFVQAAVPIVP